MNSYVFGPFVATPRAFCYAPNISHFLFFLFFCYTAAVSVDIVVAVVDIVVAIAAAC